MQTNISLCTIILENVCSNISIEGRVSLKFCNMSWPWSASYSYTRMCAFGLSHVAMHLSMWTHHAEQSTFVSLSLTHTHGSCSHAYARGDTEPNENKWYHLNVCFLCSLNRLIRHRASLNANEAKEEKKILLLVGCG